MDFNEKGLGVSLEKIVLMFVGLDVYTYIILYLVEYICKSFEPRHDKTKIVRLRPAWTQTRIHAVRLPTLLQVEKLIANSMDPDQTARIHAGRKRTMLVLS
jgi:hypothetical protein